MPVRLLVLPAEPTSPSKLSNLGRPLAPSGSRRFKASDETTAGRFFSLVHCPTSTGKAQMLHHADTAKSEVRRITTPQNHTTAQ